MADSELTWDEGVGLGRETLPAAEEAASPPSRLGGRRSPSGGPLVSSPHARSCGAAPSTRPHTNRTASRGPRGRTRGLSAWLLPGPGPAPGDSRAGWGRGGPSGG